MECKFDGHGSFLHTVAELIDTLWNVNEVVFDGCQRSGCVN